MRDHLKFCQDLVALRRREPALRGESLNVFHVWNDTRVIAYHRWIEQGRDVVVVGSLNESTWWQYQIGFPRRGRWREIFNSDVYDHFPNPWAAGNGGAIEASGPPMHGFEQSAAITIPANGIVVFAAE
jgi:1,4-alpha-glucan branching enzyme